jgi:hypothetical protein
MHPSSILAAGRVAQGLLTYEMSSPPIPEDQRLKGAFQTQLRRSA